MFSGSFLDLCIGLFRPPPSREQYVAFLTDILIPKEKENKNLRHDLDIIFATVNVEEEPSSPEGQAGLDRQLCEQVWRRRS